MQRQHHLIVFHDVYMTWLFKSLDLIKEIRKGKPGVINEYRPLNFCNKFGTYIATTHSELQVRSDPSAHSEPKWVRGASKQ